MAQRQHPGYISSSACHPGLWPPPSLVVRRDRHRSWVSRLLRSEPKTEEEFLSSWSLLKENCPWNLPRTPFLDRLPQEGAHRGTGMTLVVQPSPLLEGALSTSGRGSTEDTRQAGPRLRGVGRRLYLFHLTPGTVPLLSYFSERHKGGKEGRKREGWKKGQEEHSETHRA